MSGHRRSLLTRQPVWRPKVLRSDNGPELVSKSLRQRSAARPLPIALIDPGKPWQNGTAERR